MKRLHVKKICAIMISGLMISGAISGCGTQADTNSSTVNSSESAGAAVWASDGAHTLQITSIEGTQVTGMTGELAAGGGMAGGTPPDGNLGEGQESGSKEAVQEPPGDSGEMPSEPPGGSGEMPSEMPDDGEMPAEMPENTGEQPGGEGGSSGQAPGGGMGFTESGEQISFTLADDTSVMVEFTQGSQEGSLEDIAEGSIVEVTIKDGTAVEITVKNLSRGGGFGGSDTVTNGTAANIIDTDSEISQKSYTSTGDDENALRIDGAVVSLDDITVDKSKGATSNTENGDFYGQNAALLALNGAEVTITKSDFTSSAQNGNGVFSYGEGTVVNIFDSTIKTTEDNSGGIQTTGGGTTNASNLEIETDGNSSAAIRSDRGGGTVVVNGGSYTTNGTGSPAIYSTADITVDNAELTANASEGVVIEGKNSVALNNSNVTGNMQGTYTDGEENIHAVMIYQSMSGDADIGTSAFSAEGGSITAQAGDLFYITNTSCTIDLSGVELVPANDVLMKIAGNDASRGWGTAGDNGGEVVFNSSAQTLVGNILVDNISSLEMNLSEGSKLTGAVNTDGAAGQVDVTLSGDSKWVLTGDSYISSFDGDTSNITADGHKLYVNGTALEL